jgi:hypothetical protein
MSVVVQEATSAQPTSESLRLQENMAAARVSFTWLGVRKALSTVQKDQAANWFGAEGKYLSAGKKLLDTSHPSFKAVTSVRSRTIAYWKSISLPFPEPGIRLIRQNVVEIFSNRINEFREQLEFAVGELGSCYSELRQAARERLGNLFDANDYPESLEGQFAIEHDFPSVEPPGYLRQLCPGLYRQECERMQSRFEQAVALAEQAFTEELARLVEHLTERLTGTQEGQPKVFRDSAVSNLTEFFQRFRELSVRSNADLDRLVDNAQQIIRGVGPQRLRNNASLRTFVADQMSQVQAGLDQLLTDRPRRNILRRGR